MAFAIVQVVIKRLCDRDRLHLMEELSTSMKLIHYSPSELFLEVKEIREHERPPIKTLPEYTASARETGLVPALGSA
jgi:glucosyl-3-phosphoglycerate synthase